MKSYICLDTETTGTNPNNGDKIVEIGCVKIENNKVTDTIFHSYVNPKMPIPVEAIKVHKITDAMVENEKIFSEIAKDLLDFIGETTVVAHNAKFDRSFVNNELDSAGFSIIPESQWIDSLFLSKAIYPGERASLDKLAERMRIDNQNRDTKGHSAIVDAKILADIFVKIIENYNIDSFKVENFAGIKKLDEVKTPRYIYSINEEEEIAHLEILKIINA